MTQTLFYVLNLWQLFQIHGDPDRDWFIRIPQQTHHSSTINAINISQPDDRNWHVADDAKVTTPKQSSPLVS